MVKMVMTDGVEQMGTSKARTAWSIADAKARFAELVDRARVVPQVITRNGTPTAVVVSVEEWERKTERKGTLAQFLLASPLSGAEIELDRSRETPRDVKL